MFPRKLFNITRLVSNQCHSRVLPKTLKNFNISNLQKSWYSSAMSDILFRQLLHYDTFTYTYIIGDVKKKDAIIIDPVIEMVERDAKLIKELGLNLKYALNTHMHADHVTGSGKLKTHFKDCQSVISKAAGAKADVYIEDDDVIKFGDVTLQCLSTPGHTDGCVTYFLKEKGWFFTGDCLFVRGCGRTDFQQGCSESLYTNVHKKILSHDDSCLIYPGHDYNGHMVSSVGEEKKFNPRLSKTLKEFKEIMDNLKLDKPKYIDIAIPANQKDGL